MKTIGCYAGPLSSDGVRQTLQSRNGCRLRRHGVPSDVTKFVWPATLNKSGRGPTGVTGTQHRPSLRVASREPRRHDANADRQTDTETTISNKTPLVRPLSILPAQWRRRNCRTRQTRGGCRPTRFCRPTARRRESHCSQSSSSPKCTRPSCRRSRACRSTAPLTPPSGVCTYCRCVSVLGELVITNAVAKLLTRLRELLVESL